MAESIIAAASLLGGMTAFVTAGAVLGYFAGKSSRAALQHHEAELNTSYDAGFNDGVAHVLLSTEDDGEA